MTTVGYLNDDIIPFPLFVGILIIIICCFGLMGCASNLYFPNPSLTLYGNTPTTPT